MITGSEFSSWMQGLGYAVPTVFSVLAALKAWQSTRQNKELIKKTDKIHTDTNGNLTAVRTQLGQANKQIKTLQDLVKAMVEDKSEKEKQDKRK